MKIILIILTALFAPTITYGLGGNVELENLSLNRDAEEITDIANSDYTFAHYGFNWNTGDSATTDWRPQGITAFSNNGRKWVAVTWYHRRHHSYKGVRVSFVDVDSSSSTYLKYRHVLLLDNQHRPLAGVHAGGVVYRNGKLFIPVGDGDSVNQSSDLYTFSLDNIFKTSDQLSTYFNYGYVLVQDSGFDFLETNNNYHISATNDNGNSAYFKPSFISYDWDRDNFLLGSYGKCAQAETNPADKNRHTDNPECFQKRDRYKHKLGWFNVDFDTHKLTQSHMKSFLTEMQGAASNYDNLWISSSYSKRSSHLHVINTKDESNTNFIFLKEWCEIEYPAGLEDLHITHPNNGNNQNLWMLTEFAADGKEQNKGRSVFAVRINKLTYSAVSGVRETNNKVSCHQL